VVGTASVSIENVVASGEVGWLVDSDVAAVRLQTVRLEGTAGLMRNTGLPEGWPIHCAVNESSGNCGPIGDGRFSDILIDVSNSYGRAPANHTAIFFGKPDQLHLIGGTIGSRVLIGNNSTVYDVGMRFQERAGQPAGIVQMPNTTGGRIFSMTPHAARTTSTSAAPDAMPVVAGATTSPADDDADPDDDKRIVALEAELSQLRRDVDSLLANTKSTESDNQWEGM
jgi:hypothetical protein